MLVVAVLAIFGLVVWAGCGSGGESTTASKTGADSLVIGVPQTPPQLDPAISSQFIESEVLVNTYDRLFEFETEEGEDGITRFVGEGVSPVEGVLAESWEVSPDRRTYTITLRDGVMSPFGNELTTKDVEWTLERSFAIEQNGPFYLTGAADIKDISSFKAIDDRTFEITTEKPNVLFFKVMALPLQAIIDSTEAKKHATRDDPWASEWLRRNTAGFGPYTLTVNNPGQEVVLEANPNYWGEKPAIETVTMREVPSSANRVALVLSGDIDIAENLTAREREQVEEGGGEIVSFEPAQQASYLNMTNTTPPFDDKRVRQAVCHALPYDDIVDTVTLGQGRRQLSPLPRPYEFYEEVFKYDYDPDRARELLAEAGYPDGFKTTLGFSTAAPEDEQTAELVQSALADVGIEVELLKQPLGTFTERWVGGDYPMSTLYVGAFVPDYTYALRIWFGDNENNFLNFMNYENPKVDRMLDQARSVFDDTEREELAKEIQRQIAEDAPVCFMVEPGVHYATVKGIEGMNYFADSALRFAMIRKESGD